MVNKQVKQLTLTTKYYVFNVELNSRLFLIRRSLKVGVLAIIGSFIEHVNVTSRALKELRARCEKLWNNTEVEIITIRTVEQVIPAHILD